MNNSPLPGSRLIPEQEPGNTLDQREQPTMATLSVGEGEMAMTMDRANFVLLDRSSVRDDLAGSVAVVDAPDNLLVRGRVMLDRRRVDTIDAADEYLEGLGELLQSLTALSASSTDGAPQLTGDPEAMALAAAVASVIAEIEEIEEDVRWGRQRADSGAIWLALDGESGAGKSTVASTISGVADVVPSWSGDPVTGICVRIMDVPGCKEREGHLVRRDGRPVKVFGDDIDRHIALRDVDDQRLDHHRDIVDAEIWVEFRNPFGCLFIPVDTEGRTGERSDEDERRRHNLRHHADGILIVDSPDPDRHQLRPTNRATYDCMAIKPSWVLINRKPYNVKNCARRRKALVELGIPAERILEADGSNIDEVNRFVLAPILRWFLDNE